MNNGYTTNPASPLNPSSVLSPANANGLFSSGGLADLYVAAQQDEGTRVGLVILAVVLLLLVGSVAALVVELRKHRAPDVR